MTNYTAPQRDMLFVLNHLAGLEDIAGLPGLEDATPDMAAAILDGKIKAGEGMEAKVKLELTYIMIENDGEEIIAIDKLNGVYRVQGEDMLADVTALI